jgi:hypothetical protein
MPSPNPISNRLKTGPTAVSKAWVEAPVADSSLTAWDMRL